MKSRNWLVLIVCMVFLNGCAYRLGNQPPEKIQTISVGKVNVDRVRGEPRLAVWAAEKIRNAIATDNTLKLTESKQADAHLEVSVREYRSHPAGSAKLTSDDPDQRRYTTSIWRAQVILEFRLIPKGSDPGNASLKRVVGTAEYGDLIDITVMRQDAARQALVNASRKLVREMLNTW